MSKQRVYDVFLILMFLVITAAMTWGFWKVGQDLKQPVVGHDPGTTTTTH